MALHIRLGAVRRLLLKVEPTGSTAPRAPALFELDACRGQCASLNFNRLKFKLAPNPFHGSHRFAHGIVNHGIVNGRQRSSRYACKGPGVGCRLWGLTVAA